MNIVKKLARKPHINGISHWTRFDLRQGIKDYKSNQLCEIEEGYVTPWILKHIRYSTVYSQKMYSIADKALDPVAQKIASNCQELESLVLTPIPDNLDSENLERLAASHKSMAAHNSSRRNDILRSLAVYRTDIENLDVALKHHLQRAENITYVHISAYWSGVLKAANAENLPPHPQANLPVPPGKDVYEKNLANIKKRLAYALNDQQKEDYTNEHF